MSRRKPENDPEPIPRISLAGFALVASPGLADSVFGNSVCIVVEHSKERAIGIVLNKPLEIDASPIWEQILEGSKSAGASAHVNFGGPQSGPVLAIHDVKDLAEGGNQLGVYLAAQQEHLKALTESQNGRYRLFIGHAVWGPSELEQQIVEGVWHVLPAIPELVFDEEGSMWLKAIRTVGNRLVEEITGASYPNGGPGLN
jgi:putative transcriptional regulator